MGTLTVVTQPTVEPVTISEVKEHLRIECDEESAVKLKAYITTARQYMEKFTDLFIPSQTVEWSCDRFPSTVIELDTWPIQSIDSVKYDDTSSPVTEQTLVENTDYYADIVTDGGRVGAITGWPSTAAQFQTVRIRMTAGYVDNTVPEQLKQAIIMYVGSLYECDESLVSKAEAVAWPLRRNV